MSEIKLDEKRKYPKSIFFIVVNEFCERFTYYGMKTILSLYFSNSLKFDNDTSTALYHTYSMLSYFFPIFGAIIADSFLGKFKTILYLSILYAFGNIVVSIAAIPIIPLPRREISFLGLLMIAVGTGGIKPCVSSFGAEQFDLPEQASQQQRYFTIFLFFICAGCFLASFLAPTLRKDVQCFGEDSCFSLAFSIPALIMIISIIIFLCGKRMYKITMPEENVIVVFFKCVTTALKNKIFKKSSEVKKHWLEYADDKFSKKQISDIRIVLNLLLLFTPIPIFWTLSEQQGSRWTFQSTFMDGRFFGYVIKPDLMHIISPLLWLFLLPLFELYVFPVLRKLRIKTPLQRIGLGGFLCAIAFMMSACLEIFVQKSYIEQLKSGYGQLRLFNSLNCDIRLNPPFENVSHIASMSEAKLSYIPVEDTSNYEITFETDSHCPYKLNSHRSNLKIFEEKAVSYFISRNSEKSLSVYQINQFDELVKDADGYAKIRIYYGSPLEFKLEVKLENSENGASDPTFNFFIENNTGTDFVLIPPSKYNLVVNEQIIMKNIVIEPAEIDVILLHQNASNLEAKLINLAPPNTVHMLWQIPQLLVISFAEVSLYLTGLKFSFTEAPKSMKSVLSAAWLLNIAIGDVIVIAITEMKLFNDQAYEYMFYAGLMILDMILFIKLSADYKYVNLYDELEENTADT